MTSVIGVTTTRCDCLFLFPPSRTPSYRVPRSKSSPTQIWNEDFCSSFSLGSFLHAFPLCALRPLSPGPAPFDHQWHSDYDVSVSIILHHQAIFMYHGSTPCMAVVGAYYEVSKVTITAQFSPLSRNGHLSPLDRASNVTSRNLRIN